MVGMCYRNGLGLLYNIKGTVFSGNVMGKVSWNDFGVKNSVKYVNGFIVYGLIWVEVGKGGVE